MLLVRAILSRPTYSWKIPQIWQVKAQVFRLWVPGNKTPKGGPGARAHRVNTPLLGKAQRFADIALPFITRSRRFSVLSAIFPSDGWVGRSRCYDASRGIDQLCSSCRVAIRPPCYWCCELIDVFVQRSLPPHLPCSSVQCYTVGYCGCFLFCAPYRDRELCAVFELSGSRGLNPTFILNLHEIA